MEFIRGKNGIAANELIPVNRWPRSKLHAGSVHTGSRKRETEKNRGPLEWSPSSGRHFSLVELLIETPLDRFTMRREDYDLFTDHFIAALWRTNACCSFPARVTEATRISQRDSRPSVRCTGPLMKRLIEFSAMPVSYGMSRVYCGNEIYAW